MTITRIAHAQGQSTDGINATAGATADTRTADCFIAWTTSFNGVDPPQMVDSAGNTWLKPNGPLQTGVSVPFAPSGGSPFYTVRLDFWYCMNPTTSATHLFSVNGGGRSGFPSFQVRALKGVSQATLSGQPWPFLVDGDNFPIVSSHVTSGTEPTTVQADASILPTEDGCAVMSAIAFYEHMSGAISVNSGMSISDQCNFVADESFGSGAADIIQTSATAIQPTWTLPTASWAAMLVMVLRAEAAAPPSPPAPPPSPAVKYVVPVLIGCPYTSRAQLLRPDFGQDAGTRAGPAFGKKRRLHWHAALLYRTRSISFGTNFTAKRQKPAKLGSEGDTPIGSTELFSGIISTTTSDDYSWESQLAWEQKRPTPGTITAVAGYLEAQEK